MEDRSHRNDESKLGWSLWADNTIAEDPELSYPCGTSSGWRKNNSQFPYPIQICLSTSTHTSSQSQYSLSASAQSSRWSDMSVVVRSEQGYRLSPTFTSWNSLDSWLFSLLSEWWSISSTTSSRSVSSVGGNGYSCSRSISSSSYHSTIGRERTMWSSGSCRLLVYFLRDITTTTTSVDGYSARSYLSHAQSADSSLLVQITTGSCSSDSSRYRSWRSSYSWRSSGSHI